MTLTESMRRAGWRECPDDAVRIAWESKGGRWQIMQWLYDGFTPAYIRNPDPKYAHLGLLDCEIKGAWRPVNPETWDYDPRGWGEQPAPVKICGVCYGFGITRAVYKSAQKCSECDGMGYKESEAKNAQPALVVPDRPDDNGGAWWYRCNNGSTLLCYISSSIVSIIESRDIPSYEGDRIELSRMQQTYRGQWIGPCTKPEASNGKP